MVNKYLRAFLTKTAAPVAEAGRLVGILPPGGSSWSSSNSVCP